MRIKAYSRRKESVNYNQQQALLTKQRGRIEALRECPAQFERDALRRVDRGMKAFFRRVKLGDKPGFPRFRPWFRYKSMEFLAPGKYIAGNFLKIPKLGLVRFRGGKQKVPETQKLLRIIHRASGWYAQVLVNEANVVGNLEDHGDIGIDVGLKTFATMSDGSVIKNPRFYKKSERKLKCLQRSVSSKAKGSRNRRKAVKRLAKQYEKVSLQRRNFCHQASTELVRKHPLIAVEKLNIKKMLGSKRFSKSISDAGWGIFLNQLTVKAENAGRVVIQVDPAGTSQECPNCGAVKKKKLSERIHRCQCGCTLDRDAAASRIILARGLRALGSNRLLTDLASDSQLVVVDKVGRLTQEHERLTAR